MSFMRENPGCYEQHYESLRREALSRDRGLERGHGLALFLSQGMLAWMKAVATLQPPHVTPLVETLPGPFPAHPKLAKSIRGELRTVLAAMVLACSRNPAHE